MPKARNSLYKSASPYTAVLTREQFLFCEMRTTAKLLCSGIGKEAVCERIVSENLFQYPTEKSLKRMALVCMKRLDILNNDSLTKAIAEQSSEVAKQICLYAMMKQYRLVWDFMITVIGAKYQWMDTSFGKIDLNTFFFRLQEQDDAVAAWSDSTIGKLKQVLLKMLVDNEYLDNTKANRLNPVLISPILENAIRDEGKEEALPAFRCLL